MFYPEAMTEIELVVPAKDLLPVTKVLSGRGVFQQTDASYMTSEKGITSPNTWQDKTAIYASLERRIQNILQALDLSEAQPPSTEFEAMTDIEITLPVIEQIEGEVKRINDQLVSETKRVEQLENNLHQLEPIADIDIDISTLKNQRYLFSTLGVVPIRGTERLQESLSRIPFFFKTLREDNQKAVVWLAGSRTNIEILERAMRSAYFIPLALPDGYQGTPAKIIEELHNNIEESKHKIGSLKDELAKIAGARKVQLHGLYWDVHSSRVMADAILRFGRLKYTYLIVGWTPTRGLAELTQHLKVVSKEILIEAFPTSRGEGKKDVPVELKHSRLLGPFQMMVTTYARPQYGELDPTWLIALTFPLIYGAMFGDVGQGIVLALFGWLLASRRVQKLRGLASLGGLILACGVAATIFGFLYGSFFGFEDVIHAIWIRPRENIFLILEIAIGAGIILLSIGFLIGIFNSVVTKNWSKLLFDKSGIPGLLLYWSILAFAGLTLLKVTSIPPVIFLVLAAIGAVAIMFSELLKSLLEGHRPLINDSIGTFAIQAFFELFETLISLLSNTLSYVRIGAFAVAHGGLSQAIFIIAGLFGSSHSIGYAAVIVLGNLFIIGFEGLIVGIQTMRLEYYEFFSKFFEGGGKRYEPLTLRPVVDE